MGGSTGTMAISTVRFQQIQIFVLTDGVKKNIRQSADQFYRQDIAKCLTDFVILVQGCFPVIGNLLHVQPIYIFQRMKLVLVFM